MKPTAESGEALQMESTDFDEQYFKKLVSSSNRTLSKVRRIDIDELMELAWVDGKAEPFAERLKKSRPELASDIQRALDELRS